MSCPSYHDRHVILLGRCISHQAAHYTVLVSDYSKIRKVPLQRFSLWCMRTDRPVQGTRFVTMQRYVQRGKPRNISA
jgi:hypothetical protein